MDGCGSSACGVGIWICGFWEVPLSLLLFEFDRMMMMIVTMIVMTTTTTTTTTKEHMNIEESE